MADNEIRNLIIISTFIFALAPTFVVIYIMLYNQRRKQHAREKDQMRETFDAEIAKAEQEIKEQTMQTIGADLHDNVGQLLSLTSLTLKSIDPEEPSKSASKVNSAIELISHSIQEMRLLGRLLQGEQLISQGLDEAIRHEIRWMEKSGKYTVIYLCEVELPASNPDKDLIIFRILQEILNNIIKHAMADQLTITLEHADAKMCLCISDNGIGFDTDKPRSDQMGMGLYNIQKRAALVGGEAIIESRLSKGTSIMIIIPYP